MRSAQKQASNAETTAGQTGANLMSEGQAIGSNLVPQLTRDVNAQHVMTPEQRNEMLTAAGAGAGGATGATGAEAELESARTGQGAGLTPTLAALNRNRGQQLAKASEGIASEDVGGALQRQEEARQQLGGLYATNTGDALKAMGIQTGDINAETEAGKSGWFQNMTSLMEALKPGGKMGQFSFGGSNV
jgi:hypothetical protein